MMFTGERANPALPHQRGTAFQSRLPSAIGECRLSIVFSIGQQRTA